MPNPQPTGATGGVEFLFEGGFQHARFLIIISIDGSGFLLMLQPSGIQLILQTIFLRFNTYTKKRDGLPSHLHRSMEKKREPFLFLL